MVVVSTVSTAAANRPIIRYSYNADFIMICRQLPFLRVILYLCCCFVLPVLGSLL